jgi:sporulation protein YlmC with PRC-barrel domain
VRYPNRDIYGLHNQPKFAPPLLAHGPGPHLMGAETLIGNRVINLASETLGDIKEIMLDVEKGCVGYAVLSFSTYLGFGEKLFAVPWKLLTLEPMQKCFVLDVSLKRLKDAPGFDKGHWPDMKDVDWQQSVHSFYSGPVSGG